MRRDPNDAWVSGPQGRFWGREGAAGLLAYDPDRGVLLQHRVAWSDQGGTWGLPGGARQVGESAIDAAKREAAEEAAVPPAALTPRFTYVYDVGYWSYTTVAVDVTEPFEPKISDPESEELRGVAIDDIDGLPLHPGFGAAWPALRARLATTEFLIVDAANVVGSRPDGWWRDRAGATQRLIDRVAALRSDGVPGEWYGLDRAWRLWPSIAVVLEGQAKRVAESAADDLRIVHAPGEGDDEIVRLAKANYDQTVVVTADRGLRDRLAEIGAQAIGPGALFKALSDDASEN